MTIANRLIIAKLYRRLKRNVPNGSEIIFSLLLSAEPEDFKEFFLFLVKIAKVHYRVIHNTKINSNFGGNLVCPR